jgi:hypothetical protein
MSHKSAPSTVSTIGIDLGKNSFHLIGLDQRGAIVLQLKCSRTQLERRLANIPSCLIGMEACSGARREILIHDDTRCCPSGRTPTTTAWLLRIVQRTGRAARSRHHR